MRPTRILLLPLAVVALVAVSCGSDPDPEAAEWEVDPDADLDPTTSRVPILVHETECASGRAADGRIEVTIDYRSDEVELDVRVRPRGGDQECPSNPTTPYTVELDEPLGGRAIVGERPIGGNGSDDEQPATTGGTGGLDALADRLGCESPEELDYHEAPIRGGAASAGISCEFDGADVHIFLRNRVGGDGTGGALENIDRLLGTGVQGGVECGVLVAEDWFITGNRTAELQRASELLGGVTRDIKPIAPPASYYLPGCGDGKQ